MSELELKLMLLRYNMLSKKKAEAVHRCRNAGEYTSYGDEWEVYISRMMKMERDLRKDGYEFAFTSIKTAGEVWYSVYKLVPIDNP